MKIYHLSFVLLYICLNNNSVLSYKSKSKKDQCKLCSDLIDNFIKGFKKTSKGNFGGGNTDWEDRKLGSYVTSDIRFEEIIENSCSNKENDCHHLLEDHEDDLLEWFKTKQNRIENDLYSHICIENKKICCPKETYGVDCKSCPKFRGLKCSGNGECDGDGTREGTGKCICNKGYTGDDCFSCSNGFYEDSKNETHLICMECHRSCQTCIGPDQDTCLSCKSGWQFNSETSSCDDVNECLEENKCQKSEFCVNNEGSYKCQKCDVACQECTGLGAHKCIGDCNNGYEKVEDKCVDINECERNSSICSTGECVNKPGSYECKKIEPLNDTLPSSSNGDISTQNVSDEQANKENDLDHDEL
ncbi:unnamed protein product [Brachionus calyciflorus]|uniref:Uncharacterized protein n=1 Tax=Brachionus calyciflorus TaxID=104777 RepID=A0A813QRE1_9BILA|nr:unnamed protein product [Brachionus calyciflorus]